MDMKNLDGWTELGPYEEDITEKECIMTEFVDGKTVRTFNEYKVIFSGIKYQKNSDVMKVQINRKRLFQRRYQEQL